MNEEKEQRLIEKRFEGCKHNYVCWQDYEIGIWRKKELKCEDIRKILEE